MFKVGDIVKIMEYNDFLDWYTTDFIKVIGYDKDNNRILVVNKKFKNASNKIHECRVKELTDEEMNQYTRQERSKKLNKICSRQEI